MPSLLSPSSSSSTRAYSPLADEVNPPFGRVAPAPTSSNGAIVYVPSMASSSSSLDSDARSSGRFHHRSESEETISPGPSQKGKQRVVMDGYAVEDAEGDLGELRRGKTIKAKGKAKAWDEEMGKVQVMDAQDDGSYPPLNEEEEEERRVQENLARFAARDTARRRAARLSRTLPQTASTPNSPSPPSSSYMRRPFSFISSLTPSPSPKSKRTSTLGGIMEGFLGPSKSNELPTTAPHAGSSADQNIYTNPYDSQKMPPLPQMIISPTSPPNNPLPLTDGGDTARASVPDAIRIRRESSSSSASIESPVQSPTEQGFSYGYAGPSWRGGASVQAPQDQQATGDKWWYALCAWGSDLDGDHDETVHQGGQAGRTNPFE